MGVVRNRVLRTVWPDADDSAAARGVLADYQVAPRCFDHVVGVSKQGAEIRLGNELELAR